MILSPHLIPAWKSYSSFRLLRGWEKSQRCSATFRLTVRRLLSIIALSTVSPVCKRQQIRVWMIHLPVEEMRNGVRASCENFPISFSGFNRSAFSGVEGGHFFRSFTVVFQFTVLFQMIFFYGKWKMKYDKEFLFKFDAAVMRI